MFYSKLLKSIIAVVMVVVATVFVGCSKADDGASGEYAGSPIVGTWSLTERGTEDGVSWSYQETLTLKANGKFTLKVKVTYDGESESDSVSGTFEFSDPYLYLYGEGGELRCRVSFSADEKRMSVTGDWEGEYTRQ